MKKITQEELDKSIKLHGMWKQIVEGGIKLDLSYYDLSGLSLGFTDLIYANLEGANLDDANLEDANLRHTNFKGANLRYANLEGSNLRYARLEGANLEDANLRHTNFKGANLRYANLEGSNLEGVRLWGTIGDGTYIKNINSPNTYKIAYTHNRLQIGCENHSIEDWTNFSDDRIIKMDGKKALKFWREYKDYILDTIDRFPAKNTCN